VKDTVQRKFFRVECQSVIGVGVLAVVEALEQRKSRRRTKIETLPFKDEVNERLVAGDSAAEVSEWLRTEKGVIVSERAVRRYFRIAISPIKAMRGSYYAKITAGMKKKLDALEELYKAAQVQMKRLSIGLEIEQTKNTMLGPVDRGLDLLRRILLDIATLEMDLGIRRRVSTGETPRGISDEQLRDILQTIIDQNKKAEQVSEPTATT